MLLNGKTQDFKNQYIQNSYNNLIQKTPKF